MATKRMTELQQKRAAVRGGLLPKKVWLLISSWEDSVLRVEEEDRTKIVVWVMACPLP